MFIRRLVHLSLAAALSVAFSAFLAPETARAQDPFLVPDVPIAATAESADKAREAALAAGQREALRRLWEKLVPRSGWGRVPPLPEESFADIVRDFSLASEETATDSYAARLTVRFDGQLARSHLRNYGVPYSKVVAPPLAVLPLYGPPSAASLWDGDNPWRDHWQRRSPDRGLVPLVTPLGDVEDLAAIDTARALAADPASLSAIAERYGAAGVLLTRAEPSGDPAAGTARLDVETRVWGAAEYPGSSRASFSQTAGEDLEVFLARVADAVAAPLQENWKEEHLLIPGELKTLEVGLQVSSLEEWVDIERRIEGAAVVDRSLPRMLSRDEVVVAIEYFGSEDGLARALAQQALQLEPAPAPLEASPPVETATAPPAADSGPQPPRWRLLPLHGGAASGRAVTVTE